MLGQTGMPPKLQTCQESENTHPKLHSQTKVFVRDKSCLNEGRGTEKRKTSLSKKEKNTFRSNEDRHSGVV